MEYVYRYTSELEYEKMIKDNFLEPLHLKYISLSSDICAYDGCEFERNAEYLLTFDREKLEEQGLIHIEYDFGWLSKQDNSIIKHITNCNTIDRFISKSAPDSAELTLWLYSWENECIIARIDNINNILLEAKKIR